MIRITIETNAKTGVGYQLHLKDTTRHREWIAYDDMNGLPGGKPFLDIDSTLKCAEQIILADFHFSKEDKKEKAVRRGVRIADEALEANKDRDIGARRMLADMKKGRFGKVGPDPSLYSDTMQSMARVKYGKKEPGKPQKVKVSITPMTLVLGMLGQMHKRRFEPAFAEMCRKFFEIAAGQGMGEGGASAMMEQYYAMEEETANSWIVQLIEDAGLSEETLKIMITETLMKYEDDLK